MQVRPGLSPARPVPVRAWRVRAVIPCFNRRKDAEALLSDLAAAASDEVDLHVVLVDNASAEPLATIPTPPGLSLEHLRLDTNTGGSGGFNAGMARILARGVPGDRSELIWLLDSDARLEPGAMKGLLAALAADPTLVAVGSALVDPASGEVFECGGWLNRRTGAYEQPLVSGWERLPTVPCDYLAACSLMVRRWAVERAGLMADLFVNGDDVEWSFNLARRTGGRIAAVPGSRAVHPHPDRMRTWARYYAARNGFAPMAAAGCGPVARFRRAVAETGRALGQVLIGRDDLAALHLRGLEDAVQRRRGAAPEVAGAVDAWTPLVELPATLRRILADRPPRGRVLVRSGVIPDERAVQKALNAACVGPVVEPEREVSVVGGLRRAFQAMLLGPRWGVAVVSARAWPADWMAGGVIVSVAPEGFVVRRTRRMERLGRAVCTLARGGLAAWRLAKMKVVPEAGREGFRPTTRPSVAVVVLSYNRWAALEATLRKLGEDPALAGASIIVVDNGSSDGTGDRLRREFPTVTVLELGANRGVEAFNEGAGLADADTVLILDDDACPDAGILGRALDLLGERPDLGAVALHPKHPATGASEWGFGERAGVRDDWPVMGCANLVRRHAWERVGGYDAAFFLYRNDTDLAMKLLEAGFGVRFDPAWVAWHDSPGAAAKSGRWFNLATRNWVWVCRRHGRGASKLAAAIMGWVWAHKLAGLSLPNHARALWGFVRGWFTRPPALPDGLLVDGRPLRTLLTLRLGR